MLPTPGPDRREWLLETAGGLVLARCEALLDLDGMAHAFSTRQADGRQDFDLGPPDCADIIIEKRRRRFCDVAGLKERAPLILRQQHGSEIIRAPITEAGELPAADGVLLLRGEDSSHVAAVRTADCVPILLADRRGRAAAAVHAGWRGTAAGIAFRAVEMFGRLGVEADDLVAALGPSIGPCCYEVGPEVLSAIVGGGGTHLDLAGANVMQLVEAGLPAGSIFRAPWCTACRNDLFFSHRREGGAAGRLMACIGWVEKGARLTPGPA